MLFVVTKPGNLKGPQDPGTREGSSRLKNEATSRERAKRLRRGLTSLPTPEGTCNGALVLLVPIHQRGRAIFGALHVLTFTVLGRTIRSSISVTITPTFEGSLNPFPFIPSHILLILARTRNYLGRTCLLFRSQQRNWNIIDPTRLEPDQDWDQATVAGAEMVREDRFHRPVSKRFERWRRGVND